MSTADLLNRLVQARDDIAAAIRVKGVTPGSGLEDFPENILSIQGGGGEEEYTVWQNAAPNDPFTMGVYDWELRDAPSGFPTGFSHVRVYYKTNEYEGDTKINCAEFAVYPENYEYNGHPVFYGVFGAGIEGGYDCARYFEVARGSFYGYQGDSAHYAFLHFVGLTGDGSDTHSVPIKVTCLNKG